MMRQEQMLFLAFIGLFASFIWGYYGQKHLPPPKPTIIGIDLGTTFSCVGAFQAGTGEQLIFRPEENKTTIPSIVGFTPDGILIGRAARRQAETNPFNTIYDAKRFIGKTFTEEEISHLRGIYPFRIHRRTNGSACFLVEHASTTPYHHPVPHTEAMSHAYQDMDRSALSCVAPEEIGAIIIRLLKKVAEKELSTSMRPVNVRRTVMSVPADFLALKKK